MVDGKRLDHICFCKEIAGMGQDTFDLTVYCHRDGPQQDSRNLEQSCLFALDQLPTRNFYVREKDLSCLSRRILGFLL